MFKSIGRAVLSWMRRKRVTIVVVLVLMGVIAFILVSAEQDRSYPGSYSSAQAAAYMESMALHTGNPSEITMRYGGELWVQAAAEGPAKLWVEPAAGKLALQTGDVILTSNPTADQLADDQSKGQIRTNIQSPLMFRYKPEGQTSDRSANLKDARVQWRAIDKGIGFLYSIESLGFSFYVEYTLDRGALVVHIPELGVTETKKNELTALDVLPYFGAVQDGREDGYILVPDGPGALIHFNKEQTENMLPYNFPIYDEDNAAPNVDRLSGMQGVRTGIAFPVFGMNRGSDGFICIVEEGATKTNIVAAPAGVSSGFNQANARIQLRRYYEEVINATTSNFHYEKTLIFQPFTSRYLPLEAAQSDYVGMAKSYRGYLMADMKVSPLEEKTGAPPLQLNVLLGTSEMNANGSRFVTATTLKQAGEMVGKLQADGVSNLTVGLEGWQQGGYPGRLPDRFPVNSEVGGTAGMKSLVSELRSEGVPVYLNDALYYARPKFGNGFSVSKHAARDISGVSVNKDILTQTGPSSSYYLINPQRMLDVTLPAAMEQYQSLGVSGVKLMGLGGILYSDFHSNRYIDREQAADLVRRMLQEVKEQVGSVTTSGLEDLQGGSNGGYAYAIGLADHLSHFPMAYNYDIVVDEQVPFYPIAVHGLVTYSGMEGNLHANPQIDFLREIEYGALPSYLLTEANPNGLERTSFYWLYSSQFSVWESTIASRYKAFDETMNGVWGSFIDNHRKLARDVYETTYEGGRRIWVNYSEQPYSLDGKTVQPLSYAVVDKGGTP